MYLINIDICIICFVSLFVYWFCHILPILFVCSFVHCRKHIYLQRAAWGRHGNAWIKHELTIASCQKHKPLDFFPMCVFFSILVQIFIFFLEFKKNRSSPGLRHHILFRLFFNSAPATRNVTETWAYAAYTLSYTSSLHHVPNGEPNYANTVPTTLPNVMAYMSFSTIRIENTWSIKHHKAS